MNESDLNRLKDMLDCAREVTTFTTGATRESLDTDLKLVRALSMSVGIIGEAASRVSPECRAANPHIPWRGMIGMRNFLIHGYSSLDYERLWETVTKAVPTLIVDLEKLIPPEANESE